MDTTGEPVLAASRLDLENSWNPRAGGIFFPSLQDGGCFQGGWGNWLIQLTVPRLRYILILIHPRHSWSPHGFHGESLGCRHGPELLRKNHCLIGPPFTDLKSLTTTCNVCGVSWVNNGKQVRCGCLIFLTPVTCFKYISFGIVIVVSLAIFGFVTELESGFIRFTPVVMTQGEYVRCKEGQTTSLHTFTWWAGLLVVLSESMDQTIHRIKQSMDQISHTSRERGNPSPPLDHTRERHKQTSCVSVCVSVMRVIWVDVCINAHV